MFMSRGLQAGRGKPLAHVRGGSSCRLIERPGNRPGRIEVILGAEMPTTKRLRDRHVCAEVHARPWVYRPYNYGQHRILHENKLGNGERNRPANVDPGPPYVGNGRSPGALMLAPGAAVWCVAMTAPARPRRGRLLFMPGKFCGKLTAPSPSWPDEPPQRRDLPTTLHSNRLPRPIRPAVLFLHS